MKGILSHLLLAQGLACLSSTVELYSEASIVLRTVSRIASRICLLPHWSRRPYLTSCGITISAVSLQCTVVPNDTSEYPVSPENKVLWALVGIRINVLTSDTDLRHGIDESYELEIRPVIDNDGYILLQSQTVYSAVHYTDSNLYCSSWSLDGLMTAHRLNKGRASNLSDSRYTLAD
jgi:hypothetical protein